MSRAKNIKGTILLAAVAGAVLYVVLSVWAFRRRHAWMTETELFLHMPEAMSWQTVDYESVRLRKR